MSAQRPMSPPMKEELEAPISIERPPDQTDMKDLLPSSSAPKKKRPTSLLNLKSIKN